MRCNFLQCNCPHDRGCYYLTFHWKFHQGFFLFVCLFVCFVFLFFVFCFLFVFVCLFTCFLFVCLLVGVFSRKSDWGDVLIEKKSKSLDSSGNRVKSKTLVEKNLEIQVYFVNKSGIPTFSMGEETRYLEYPIV